MTDPERKACEGLGVMIVGVIRDIGAAPGPNAYARKTVTFPDGNGGKGSVIVIVCKSEGVAAAAEAGISQHFEIEDCTPKSEVN